MTQSAVDEDFQTVAEPYRRELLAYCYRMLGSVHDAEDLVQETYLRAWRAYDRFEGRSSLRTWLYRIATNACLTALESKSRRPLPSGLGAPSPDPQAELVAKPEVAWLEPVPDTLVGAESADPAAIVTSRESIRLALITALQHLPSRQRAVLIMRDVLCWRAAEVASLLGTSTVAVNSMLQRARAQLSELAPVQDEVTGPVTVEQQRLLERYVAAFENYDTQALADLFSSDAVWEMPPYTGWWQTPERIVKLIETNCPAAGPGDLQMLATQANGQPAFGMYLRHNEHGVSEHRAFQVQVVHLRGTVIDHVAAFFDTSLFEVFGLPAIYPART